MKNNLMRAKSELLTCIHLLVLCVFLWSCGGSSSNNGEESDGGGGSVDIAEASKGDFASFFTSGIGSANKTQTLNSIDGMIDPTLGAYLIYKPGAMSTPVRFTSVEELKSIFSSIDEALALIDCKPVEGELPYYDCDSFDKEGCYYKNTSNGNALQDYMKQMEEMLFSEFTDAEKTNAENADGAVSTVVVSTNAYVEMGFGRINGEWKLITINIAKFDCGA